MRDPKVIKLEGLEFNAVKNAFAEMRAAGDRLTKLVEQLTGVTDYRKFILNTKYEGAGFYLYEEITCHCGKIHEIGDPPSLNCMVNIFTNMQPQAVVNVDATGILPNTDPIKKH